VKQFADGFQSVLNEPRPAAERHARAFLRLVVERGGLMQESEAGQFRFVHLTFQEYLAASAVAHGEDPFAQVEKHLHDPWWREVILLAGGELSRQRSYRVKSDTTAWLNGIMKADTWAEKYVHRDLQLAAQSVADMSETGADAQMTADIAGRLVNAVLEWWDQKPVANLSNFIRQLPVGHLTRAIASALPGVAPRGKSRYGIPTLVISYLLPDAVIDTPLIAAYIERSADENAYAAWDGVLLALKHGSAAEGQAAFARFRAGAASGDWPIAAKETSELFALGHHEFGEAALAFARKVVPETPTNQSVGCASLLVQHGTPEDRRATIAQLIADLATEDSTRTYRALYELSQIAEYADTTEIKEAVKRILTRIGHPRVSTSAHLLQIAAVKLWTALTNRGVNVDYTPLLPVATGPWDEHLEEAFALILKHGSDAHRKAVRSNLKTQMTAAPSDKSSAILIFLSRFDPDADLRELASWAEELATKKEPPGGWRVWEVLRFLGEKAWTCPRSIQRLVEEAKAKDTIGRISLTRLALLLRTRPENVAIRLPSVAALAEAALYFAAEKGSVECVTALASLSELGKPIENDLSKKQNQTSTLS
ncbi:MAG TPA: hypothetical protein VK961_02810, partial [Chthoniobacter sp.]|nr:hypothetical protein [Chthoniobacter sp.]